MTTTNNYFEGNNNEDINALRAELAEKLGFDYSGYAMTKTCRNDGAKGNAFEMLVKLAMGNKRFKGVAKARQADTTKKINGERVAFECKTGSGEIARLDMDGNILPSPTLKSQYIIYCLKFDAKKTLDTQEIFVIETAAFLSAAKENKLTRTKVSTAMKNSDIPDELKYRDIFSLSTDGVSRSTKMLNMLYDLIDEGFGMMFDEFLETL